MIENLANISRLAQTFQQELNSPLATLSMNTELLSKESTQNKTVMERARNLHDGIMRMKAVLGKLDNLYKPVDRLSVQDVEIWEDSLHKTVN